MGVSHIMLNIRYERTKLVLMSHGFSAALVAHIYHA
jgi:hypothetical protein